MDKKWTYERCKEEASKYKSKYEFRTGSCSAHKAAYKNGWLNDFFENLIKPSGYWTYERCKEEASKYNCKIDMRKNAYGVYNIAYRNGWLKDFFPENIRKTKDYWTYEHCKEEALKCGTRKKFSQKHNAYYIALENGWVDEFFERIVKPSGYWTYERCKEEASKYMSRTEFREGSPKPYAVCNENRWLDDFFGECRKEIGYWGYDECCDAASKCESRSEFSKKFSTAYDISRKNDWLKVFFPIEKRKPNGYWNYEHCREESLKYDSRSDFKYACSAAYTNSRKNGWLDDFTWLNNEKFNFKGNIDSVYCYEFTEMNAVYVGRTLMKYQKIRDYCHIFDIKKDAVAKFANENNIKVPPMKILEENLTIKEGSEKEGVWLEIYRNNGWKILNRVKTGGVGALYRGKWSKKKCKEEALKWGTIEEFRKNAKGAYNKSYVKGWLNEFFDNVVIKKRKCKKKG